MNFITTNIKHLRKSLNLSQDELGKKLSIKRSTIGNWEKGKNYPNLETMVVLSDYFKVSIDNLIKSDLTEKEPEYIATKDYIINHIDNMVHEESKYNKPRSKNLFVPVGARAGYLEGWNDEDLHAKLEPINIPNLPMDVEARTFEIEGSSMFPTLLTGDHLVCTRFETPHDEFREDEIYVIITRLHGILVKFIQSIHPQLVLISKNQEYPPIIVEPSDVREIWRGRYKITRQIDQGEDPRITKLQTEVNTLERVIELLKS